MIRSIKLPESNPPILIALAPYLDIMLSTISVIIGITFFLNTDNSLDLGSASYRWDDIYATNSTIQTSDRRLKEQIKPTKLGLDFINLLKSRKFKRVNPNEYPDDIRKPLDGKDKEGKDKEGKEEPVHGELDEDGYETIVRPGVICSDLDGFVQHVLGERGLNPFNVTILTGLVDGQKFLKIGLMTLDKDVESEEKEKKDRATKMGFAPKCLKTPL